MRALYNMPSQNLGRCVALKVKHRRNPMSSFCDISFSFDLDSSQFWKLNPVHLKNKMKKKETSYSYTKNIQSFIPGKSFLYFLMRFAKVYESTSRYSGYWLIVEIGARGIVWGIALITNPRVSLTCLFCQSWWYKYFCSAQIRFIMTKPGSSL